MPASTAAAAEGPVPPPMLLCGQLVPDITRMQTAAGESKLEYHGNGKKGGVGEGNGNLAALECAVTLWGSVGVHDFLCNSMR